jgi:hypothetical protein
MASQPWLEDPTYQSGINNLRFGGELSDAVYNSMSGPYGGMGSEAYKGIGRAANFGKAFTGLGAQGVADQFINQIKANPNETNISYDFGQNLWPDGDAAALYSPYSNVNYNNLRNSGSAFGNEVAGIVTNFTNTWNPDSAGNSDSAGNTGGGGGGGNNNGDNGMGLYNFGESNSSGDNGVGWAEMNFDSSFDPQAGNYQQPSYGGYTGNQTAYSPNNQGITNPQAFNPTQTASNPYAMPNLSQNAQLNNLTKTPNKSIYNVQGVQNDMNSYFQGGQQLPQIQSMMDEMKRQQALESSQLEEQMTNRGLGNSTLFDTNRADLGARQRNEQMNLATNATMQLLPMQVQLAEQMRAGDMSQRGQQTNELMSALGLQESLSQGEYGRASDVARLQDALTQSQFGREAQTAGLEDQFTDSAFARDQAISQLQEALTQGQFGRQAGAASLENQLVNDNFNRDISGRAADFNEYSGMRNFYNQDEMDSFNRRLGAFNAQNDALGRIMPNGVSGQAPGPDAIESWTSALGTILGNGGLAAIMGA